MNQIKVIHTKSERAKIAAFRPFNVLDRPVLAEALCQVRSNILTSVRDDVQQKAKTADFVARMKKAKAHKRELAAAALAVEIELDARRKRWERKHQYQLAGRR